MCRLSPRCAACLQHHMFRILTQESYMNAIYEASKLQELNVKHFSAFKMPFFKRFPITIYIVLYQSFDFPKMLGKLWKCFTFLFITFKDQLSLRIINTTTTVSSTWSVSLGKGDSFQNRAPKYPTHFGDLFSSETY